VEISADKVLSWNFPGVGITGKIVKSLIKIGSLADLNLGSPEYEIGMLTTWP
jgi:hypothetical protein